MAGNLLLDVYLKDLVPSCCVNKVYALVFDNQHQALKDPGTTVRVLTPFASAQQNSFGIILNEHAERTKYYFLNLDQSQFILPASPRGEQYYIEFWRRELAGSFDRAVDILEEVRPLIWDGDKIVNAVLGAKGINEISKYEAHISATYDSENLVLYFMGHLERNGAIVTDPLSLNLVMRDNQGNTVVNTSQSVYLPNAPGVFEWDQPGIDLDHDRTYLMTCTIQEADGTPHATASFLNCWD